MIADVTATNVAPAARRSRHNEGLSISRLFTKPGVDPFTQIEWETRRSEIKSPDGKKVVFEMPDAEAPKNWSQTALDIAADKYFRKAGVPTPSGKETSVRQMVDRVAKALRKAGENQGGYFATEADAQTFENELRFMLVNQYGAFNSPVWFNVGLAEAYGIKGKCSENFIWDHATSGVVTAPDSYSRPAASACFIVSVEDDLLDIARHVEREMRIFRFGGGSGGNYSRLRAEGESLSNGGVSSGLMSFLKVFDVSAGAIKSGGTTRRAAKLVCLDADHPDVEKFIDWKVKEEEKALALINAGYPRDFNGEAYQTVAGQNANNSVRLTDEFMQAVLADGQWQTKWRTTGKVAATLSAKKLFRKIADAAHRCADPGLMFDTTINRWNPVINTGRIEAANPCNEFHFLQNTACNLSSLNVAKFLSKKDGAWHFDVQAFRHAARIFTIAKEIIVDYASYPTREIAQNSHDYRPLGLGYANMGAALMIQGVPYDSVDGCAFSAAVNSVLCGVGYETSAELAMSKGPFPGFAHNREPMLNVIGMHQKAAHALKTEKYSYIANEGRRAWDGAMAIAERYGVRNGQVTVTAPTGTIGLLMDCDTTGIEPDFTLVKAKKLAGGGYLKIVNRSVDAALETLGYTAQQRATAVQHVLDHGTLEGWADMKPEHLPVFDCANRCGDGKRFIEPMGHIRMLAAVQPFVSGSISKTVNCPAETTVEEIETLYMEAWKRGLKCIAIYRDKSKHAQVLDSGDTKKNGKPAEAKAKVEAKSEAGSKSDVNVTPPEDAVVTAPRAAARDDRSSHGPPTTQRHRLPKKRPGGFTQEIKVGGQKLYIRTGEYHDGSIGELFIDMHKEGSTMKSMTNMFSIAVSLGLQHGVPLKEFVDAFTFMRFDPAGPVDHSHIKMSTSVVDAIFRLLAFEYMGDYGLEFVQNQPTEEEIAEMRGRKALLLAANDATTARDKAQPAKSAPVTAAPSTNGNGVYAKGNTGSFKRSMVEAQTCGRCGNLTVRTGTCSTCTACGLSTGCA